MPATLTLTRRGSFRIFQAADDSTQCGTKGVRKLFYRVEVTCPDKELDDHGFMVDQLDINKAIKIRYAKVDKFLSCERLAIDCSKMISKMVKSPLVIKVSIGMSEKAFMTCEWRKTLYR